MTHGLWPKAANSPYEHNQVLGCTVVKLMNYETDGVCGFLR